jgi:hypothetical protein
LCSRHEGKKKDKERIKKGKRKEKERKKKGQRRGIEENDENVDC